MAHLNDVCVKFACQWEIDFRVISKFKELKYGIIHQIQLHFFRDKLGDL